MERARELEGVDGEEMHPLVLEHLGHQLWEAEREPHEIELRGIGEERDVSAVGGEAPLGGRAEDARDPGVRVLHVVDGVVVGLLHGELEVEIERRVRAALKEKEARRVDADRVEDVLEEEVLARALAHALQDALVDDAHVLVEDDLPAPLVDAERGQRDLHLDEVVVRVRAPDIDLPVEPAFLEAQAVVRDVGAQVHGVAVGADDDPALLLVRHVRRVEPDGAVAVDKAPHPAKVVHRLGEVAGLDERALAEPVVEMDAELRHHALGILDDPVDPDLREDLALLLERQRAVPVALALLDLRGEVLHVVRGIAVG